MEALQGDKLKI